MPSEATGPGTGKKGEKKKEKEFLGSYRPGEQYSPYKSHYRENIFFLRMCT